MIDLYYHFGPNPTKIVLFLEEAGLPYKLVPVDTFKGDQFTPEFTRLNPNNKVPVIVDDGIVVFDSSAILIHLGEKSGQFYPVGTAEERAELRSWLMFAATGLGPYCGQAVHFRHFAPEPKDYAVNRYMFEARRHYAILDDRLSEREWIVNGQYSIVDMAVWGWTRNIDFILGADARQEYPSLMAFVDRISERPAAKVAASLRDSGVFKQSYDQEAHDHMYRHGGTQ
ncbi:glutathione S-transferase N-terminal domain-containing protein [Sphingobium phenoxybenzoativorans]|uniref:Glutathione S-transferase N-terminal domain-containing protein n=1 Tax=Sphingobium phenoxybenzoativorans TaxID=1592790 RepID=A0A975Q085_9SPHN|nr:glutathione S-transferase N-terminal domain-containing protein [Sphingobium phenoxybenzoativorans]QUT04600.1 glutathione S-transferase N-terminal domain-containing protein [Sphingobium phenoxybenzoativorans]